MGACTFFTYGTGVTPSEAFQHARERIQGEYGDEGYSGTILEKRSYVLIQAPHGRSAINYADQLINDRDPRIDDKWGPAGCIHVVGEQYLFFGWASE